MTETGELVGRRGLLRTLGVAAGAVGAAVVGAVGWAKPAAADDGDPLLVGRANDAASVTGLISGNHDWTFGVESESAFGGAALFARAETGPAVLASSVSGHGVWGNAYKAGRAAIYANADGHADAIQAWGQSGAGVMATATSGIAVTASSDTGDGVVATTDAPSGKAAVRATTIGTSSAVVASAAGGYGLDGKSATNHGVVGRASATGKAAVHGIASGSAAAVLGRATAGPGVEGVSTQTVGGVFAGSTAAVRLVPQAAAGAPTSGFHERGELLVDVNGVLFFCKTQGIPGVWKKVKLVDA